RCRGALRAQPPGFPPTRGRPARTAATRWSRWENKRGAGDRRTRTKPSRAASARAVDAGRVDPAPRVTAQPAGDFVEDYGSRAWSTSGQPRGYKSRKYNSTVPALLVPHTTRDGPHRTSRAARRWRSPSGKAQTHLRAACQQTLTIRAG